MHSLRINLSIILSYPIDKYFGLICLQKNGQDFAQIDMTCLIRWTNQTVYFSFRLLSYLSASYWFMHDQTSKWQQARDSMIGWKIRAKSKVKTWAIEILLFNTSIDYRHGNFREKTGVPAVLIKMYAFSFLLKMFWTIFHFLFFVFFSFLFFFL